MSNRDNEAVVRASVAAWNADDWESMEREFTPDIEVVAPEGWPESGVFRGWLAVRRQFERLKDPWQDEHAELLDVVAVGGERVFGRFRWITKGAASGVVADAVLFRVDTIRDGRIARTEFFYDEAAARRAADLNPPGGE